MFFIYQKNSDIFFKQFSALCKCAYAYYKYYLLHNTWGYLL